MHIDEDDARWLQGPEMKPYPFLEAAAIGRASHDNVSMVKSSCDAFTLPVRCSECGAIEEQYRII